MSVTRKNILQHLGQIEPEEEQEKQEEEDEDEVIKFFIKPDSSIKLVLEVIGLMCDGQFRSMQDYLRDQVGNYKVC